MIRVWVTRASPGAEETAARLRNLGFEPVAAPLLRLRATGEGPIDLTGVAALAFTSANGVAAFAARSDERGLPVYAVGEATARAARSRGFGAVVSADGDVAALAAAIAAHGPLAGAVLHAAPREAAGDLAGDLRSRGVPARAETVYESLAAPIDARLAALARSVEAVLLHSPKAAAILAELLARHPAPGLTAFCLSPAVAAPLDGAGLAAIAVAARPEERALLDRLTAWSPP
jgi:uroporphyrinogen-III synthase